MGGGEFDEASGGIIVNGWFPEPLVFPNAVKDVRNYSGFVMAKILEDPPLLSDEALSLSVEGSGGDEALLLKLKEGQEAIKKGELHEARVILEPCATSHLHAAALSGIVCYILGRVSRALHFFYILEYNLKGDETKNLYGSLANVGKALARENKEFHVETDAVSLLCRGKGIDVGCGASKTCSDTIGVDLTPGGATGVYGGQTGMESSADVVSSGDYMPMFKDGELDYVIARHNLEHYQDYIKTVKEWARVLRPGGVIGIIVPDHEWVDTIKLDPTHYHTFTIDSLKRFFEQMPELRLVHVAPLTYHWSIIAVVQKIPANADYDYMGEFNGRESVRVEKKKKEYGKAGWTKLAGECELEREWLINSGK